MPIGFGTFPMKEILSEMIPLADKYGYELIDTSDDYYNELFVAKAAAKTNLKIFTKFSLIDNTLNFNEYFENQLKIYKKNGVRISCYLLHWPYPFIYKKIWKKMEDLYLKGEIDEIGVCNFNVKHLKRLMKKCRIKPMYNQIELHPLFQQREIADFCAENKIKIISYSPFARMDPELFSNAQIQNIAMRHHTTVHNTILKWNMQKGYIPIPSTSNKEHIRNMSLTNLNQFSLSGDEMEIIDTLDQGKRVRFNPDTYFSLRTKVKLFIFFVLMR